MLCYEVVSNGLTFKSGFCEKISPTSMRATTIYYDLLLNLNSNEGRKKFVVVIIFVTLLMLQNCIQVKVKDVVAYLSGFFSRNNSFLCTTLLPSFLFCKLRFFSALLLFSSFFAERINHFGGNLSIYEALKHKIHAIFTLFSPQRRFRRNIWKILCLVRPNFFVAYEINVLFLMNLTQKLTPQGVEKQTSTISARFW